MTYNVFSGTLNPTQSILKTQCALEVFGLHEKQMKHTPSTAKLVPSHTTMTPTITQWPHPVFIHHAPVLQLMEYASFACHGVPSIRTSLFNKEVLMEGTPQQANEAHYINCKTGAITLHHTETQASACRCCFYYYYFLFLFN